MSGRTFLDTNILVYAYSITEPQKQALALQATQTADAFLSTQVMLEFANVARRKFNLDWSAVGDLLVELTANFSIHANTPATILRATSIAQRYSISWFDALIVAAALDCGCQTLYTEDLQHGQLLEGTLRVLNPFVV